MFKQLAVGLNPQPSLILTLLPDNLVQVLSLLGFGSICLITVAQRLMILQPVLFISRVPTIQLGF